MAGGQKNPESEASSSAAGDRMKLKSVVSSSPPLPPLPPPWVELPSDITANILQRLGAEEILESAQKVCMTWRRVCKEPSMWRKIRLHIDLRLRFDYVVMCRHAVGRSQGQLLDLTLIGFGTDSLLKYIAERSSGLRCLSLDSCYDITGKGLAEAAKGLPMLEELLLSLDSIDPEYLEQVGHSCPALKSFTLCKPPIRREVIYDSEALAIAKTMPQLRHLCLVRNRMRNKDLIAILDGCTNLDSLHLEECIHFCNDCHLNKRLSQQIKHLKLIGVLSVPIEMDSDYLQFITSYDPYD